MPDLSDPDTLKPIRRIVGPHRIDATPVPHIITVKMSWAVFDFTTATVAEFDVDGGHFTSVPGHRYLVILRATDLHGVQKITLDGSGMFRCASEVDKNGVFYEPALPLPASIPHQEFNNTGTPPKLQDLIVVMKPDIGAFDYFKLSAGFHHFNGATNLEYFAYSGVLTFSAFAANSHGETCTGSLTTTP